MSQPQERHVPTLHQQAGGMSPQAFAALQGISQQMLSYYLKAGRVIGAQQDSRSKKWTIYPPARLVDKSGDCMKRKGVSPELAPHSQISAGAAAAQQEQAEGSAADFGRHVPQVKAEGKHPPAGRVLGSAALPDAARSLRARQPASCGLPGVFASPEAKNVRRVLREAVAQQHREGIHYLRLDASEFSQLYAALEIERSRVRKLVGRGVLPVGVLRASDSVWQKLQAMCQQGRLL